MIEPIRCPACGADTSTPGYERVRFCIHCGTKQPGQSDNKQESFAAGPQFRGYPVYPAAHQIPTQQTMPYPPNNMPHVPMYPPYTQYPSQYPYGYQPEKLYVPSVVALVIACASLLFFFLTFFNVVFLMTAFILAIIGISNTSHAPKSRRLAVIALIITCVSLVCTVAFTAYIINMPYDYAANSEIDSYYEYETVCYDGAQLFQEGSI